MAEYCTPAAPGKKIISTANLPSPTEGEIVIRIGVAAHLPNLMFKGSKWKEC